MVFEVELFGIKGAERDKISIVEMRAKIIEIITGVASANLRVLETFALRSCWVPTSPQNHNCSNANSGKKIELNWHLC